jgi:peptidoglycan/xylan/chitin deacetylase (PgdA/CDA1 family)
VAVGSHTWSHPDLTALSAAEVDGELWRSRDRLEERLGEPVRSFCYPGGRWSRAVEARVREVYELAVIGGGGRLRASAVDPLRIQRVSLRSDGPRSLAPMLRARVWIEEWLADRVRRLR